MVSPSLMYSPEKNTKNTYSVSQLVGNGVGKPSYTYASYANRVPKTPPIDRPLAQIQPSFSYKDYIRHMNTAPPSINGLSGPQISLENPIFLANSVPLRSFGAQIKNLDLELIKHGMFESQEVTKRLYKNLKLERQSCYCANKNILCKCDEVVMNKYRYINY